MELSGHQQVCAAVMGGGTTHSHNLKGTLLVQRGSHTQKATWHTGQQLRSIHGT